MRITMKYYRKTFFGDLQYTEDDISAYSEENALKAMQKAFRMVIEKPESTLQISDYGGEKTVIIWQEYGDVENDLVNVKEFNDCNDCDKKKMSRTAAQKLVRRIAKEAK